MVAAAIGTFERRVFSAGDLTKALRKEDDTGTSLVVRYRGHGDTELEIHRRPWGGASTFEVMPVKGRISGSKDHNPERGAWHVWGTDDLLAIVEMLPKAAEVTFFVYLGAGTNQYLESATRGKVDTRLGEVPAFEGLHCDKLYVEADFERRGKRVRRRYLLDTSTGPQNSARFGVSY